MNIVKAFVKKKKVLSQNDGFGVLSLLSLSLSRMCYVLVIQLLMNYLIRRLSGRIIAGGSPKKDGFLSCQGLLVPTGF